MVFIPYPPGQAPGPVLPDIAGELGALRSLTTWYIEQDPTDVVLIPRTTSRTAGGATQAVDGTPRAVQRVKLIYGGNTGAGRAGIVSTGDGRERMFSFIMVAEWDAIVEPGDHFTDPAGQNWEVEETLPYNGYEIKATMRSYGGNPQYG